MEGTSYYIVHESAMPSVLKKVAEANRLLSTGEARTVNEAVERVGVARSSFYKFKDAVEEFHNNIPGSMLTIVCEVSDRAGILSDLLQTIFHIDRYDRDPAFSQTAFSDFNTLVSAYPDSVYAADAQARMIYLRDKLARHFVDVADYYYRRQAYIGAANRCKEILENFYETKYTEDALEIMIKSYHKLGLSELEERSREIMADNFPNNSYASKSAFR